MRFLVLAIASIPFPGSTAVGQTYRNPELGVQDGGACRSFSIKDRQASSTMVPFGCLSTGKWISQPDSIQIKGLGSTGDVSGMSIGGSTLPALLSLKAPLSSPSFNGTVTAPAINLSSSGSTGDGSAFTVIPKDGGSPRTLSALFSGLSVNALDYVSLADVNAQADVSTALNAAANAARDAKRPLIIPSLPGKQYIIKKPVNVSQVDIRCDGARLYTGDATNIFEATNNANVQGCYFAHDGPTGSIIVLAGSGNNKIHENNFSAGNASNPNPLIFFNGSVNHIYNNRFLNLRTNGHAWRNERNDPNIISINNSVRDNYFVGSGTGGWVGDNDQAPRPEGINVTNNDSVLTGGPFLTIKSILSARVHGNMMDQAPASTGAVLFTPGGFGNYGIDGVVFTNNYMSAVANGSAGPAFVSLAGPARGVKFVGNHMAYGTKAALLFPGIEVVFTGNDMAGASTAHCVELSDPSLLNTVVFTDNKQCTTNPIQITNYPQPGSTHSVKTVAYNTTSNTQYVEVLHGLAAKPTKFKIGVSIIGQGGAVVTSASAMAAAVTDSVLTLAVSYNGKVSDGLIWITVESEI